MKPNRRCVDRGSFSAVSLTSSTREARQLQLTVFHDHFFRSYELLSSLLYLSRTYTFNSPADCLPRVKPPPDLRPAASPASGNSNPVRSSGFYKDHRQFLIPRRKLGGRSLPTSRKSAEELSKVCVKDTPLSLELVLKVSLQDLPKIATRRRGAFTSVRRHVSLLLHAPPSSRWL